MSEPTALSFVLASHNGDEPIMPFTATYDGELYKVKKLHGKTAELEAKRDGYGVTLRTETIMVDPDVIQWRSGSTSTEPEPLHVVDPEEPQVEKASPTFGQRTCSICGTPKPPSQFPKTGHHKDRCFDCGAADTKAPAPDVLKFCPECKQQKPRSEFPPGKGFFKCNDCREALTETPPHQQAVQKNLTLAEQGMKHCGGCDQDKPFEDFAKNASKGDGYQSLCKTCKSVRWTAGSTAVRQAKEGADSSPSDVVVKSEPPNGWLAKIRQLRAERDAARAELAQVYAELEEALN